jgi:hypothetical protein
MFAAEDVDERCVASWNVAIHEVFTYDCAVFAFDLSVVSAVLGASIW